MFIGKRPPKLVKVDENRTKYIASIGIHKKTGVMLDEKWFDCEIPISTDLVAIIGNQGTGKSALTDILGLCGDANTDDCSFLTITKFCDRHAKASAFEARMEWHHGKSVTRALDSRPKRDSIERVKYVPQTFFDAVTNETEVREGGRFYSEIKKAVFSHIRKEDRLGCANLDDLMHLRSAALVESVAFLREQLTELNRQVMKLEAATSADEVEKVQSELKLKADEIDAFRAQCPTL